MKSIATALLVLSTLSTLLIFAQDEKAKPEEITPATTKAIDKGLKWLAENQNRNGSFGTNCTVAITSMSGLAFMAGGTLPDRGKYSENLKKALQYILNCVGRTGYINEGPRGQGSGMHGHGFATLFLAEIYGMTSEEDTEHEQIKDALKRAITVIESSQSKLGGWYYEPISSNDEGSVTVTQVAALRSARNAGFKVSKDVIDKAVSYIKHCTNADGTVRYQYSAGGGGTPALTAAGMSVLNYLGQYQDERLKKGLDFLMSSAPFIKSGATDKKHGNAGGLPWRGEWGSFYYYTGLYATIAMFQQGGEYWQKWFPAIRDELVKTQSENGEWTNYESSQYNPAFGTSFALLILQMPYRYLPIFQN